MTLEENLKRIQALAAGMGTPVFAVSAATHQGFDELLQTINENVDLASLELYND